MISPYTTFDNSSSGTRSALAGKTLHDMGLSKIVNLAGGIQGWLQAGGDLES
jgi:rhodanese-related sulfurtransferase